MGKRFKVSIQIDVEIDAADSEEAASEACLDVEFATDAVNIMVLNVTEL